MDAFDVVVVGNVGIDTHVNMQGDEVDFRHEANFTHNVDVLGQAGGYASRSYARLGVRTAFIGSVGDDFMGDFIKREFLADEIDIQGVFIDPEGTGRSINFIYRNGLRKNFYDGKSHMTLPAPVEQARGIFNGAKLAHFNIPHWARKLLPIARQAGAVVACDLQDVVDVDDPYRDDFVKAADYLFFSSANQAGPEELIRAYLKINPELVIVSGMGAEGCALGSKDGIQYFKPVALNLPILDTNGAGDSLAASFLNSRVLERRSLADSILRGQIAARVKCAQKATSACQITQKQMEEMINMLN